MYKFQAKIDPTQHRNPFVKTRLLLLRLWANRYRSTEIIITEKSSVVKNFYSTPHLIILVCRLPGFTDFGWVLHSRVGQHITDLRDRICHTLNSNVFTCRCSAVYRNLLPRLFFVIVTRTEYLIQGNLDSQIEGTKAVDVIFLAKWLMIRQKSTWYIVFITYNALWTLVVYYICLWFAYDLPIIMPW